MYISSKNNDIAQQTSECKQIAMNNIKHEITHNIESARTHPGNRRTASTADC